MFTVTYGLARAACNPVVLFLALFLPLMAISSHSVASSRIIVLGDSLTAGYGVALDGGVVPQLQRWLDAHGAADCEVINMSVSGDTTEGGRARLEWALAEGAAAVIVELGANDMLRGIDPAVTRGNLDAILAALAERDLPVLLVGMRSSENFGPEYKRAFDAIYPNLAAQYQAILDPFLLDGLVDKPALFQDDGLHPNAAGNAVVVERLGPMVLELIARVKE
ncbi:MAG TPA: arylesterase [Thermohalobaculum sp.]|nr:arylesterase [Thermohalobaculum sp.]